MPILDKWTIDFVSNSVEQTVRLGVRLGELLVPGSLVCLSGDLGAGKTAFTRGVGRGWGTTLRVTSPTFTLVNEYPRPHDGRILYHIDCYRLEHEADAETVGLEDILNGNGAVIIEWPERIASWLAADRLWIRFTFQSDTRRALRFSASGEQSAKLLNEYKQRAFGA
ncbi:MAG: tRNA (adenosine(37)-N6)-threonylcarbamoyltransferase complex ATPase subunit type 1 TsaE [Candidatus Promineifilaceae bacterium]|jgi:tRNA threonylcarbamoyladenosine biosynthesis protein TsaE